jgi:hypothetical protein
MPGLSGVLLLAKRSCSSAALLFSSLRNDLPLLAECLKCAAYHTRICQQSVSSAQIVALFANTAAGAPLLAPHCMFCLGAAWLGSCQCTQQAMESMSSASSCWGSLSSEVLALTGVQYGDHCTS